jgi:4-hydroxy-3-polyprenylbenzoate decarboxylase
LHFQTRTTIDTLDYSGTSLNEGSKVVIAVAGPPLRTLPTSLPDHLNLPDGFSAPKIVLPGVLLVQSPPYSSEGEAAAERFCCAFQPGGAINALPLIVLADDSDFAARNVSNFLWVTFTRSNPAADIHGMGAFTHQKHWGCEASLVIDARIKPHHAPPLEDDPEVSRRVDALGAPGGPLYRII